MKITPKPLVSDDITIADKAYTGASQDSEYTVDGLVIDEDYTEITNPAGINAGAYTVEIAGKGNYSGTVRKTWNIMPVMPTLDDIEVEGLSATYNGQPQAVTVSAKNGTGLGKATIKYGDSETAPTDAGTYAVTVEFAAGTNYTATDDALSLGDLVIEKAISAGINQTVLVKSELEKEYTVDLASLLPSGILQAQIEAYIIGTVGGDSFFGTPEVEESILTIPVADTAAVGQTAVIPIEFDSANYEIADAEITVTVIEENPIAISGISIANKVYDGTIFTISAEPVFTDIITGDVVEAVAKYDWSSIDAPIDAGRYMLTVSAEDLPEAQPVVFKLEIAKASLTITADSKTITKGSQIPTLTYTVIGFVGDDKWDDVMDDEPTISAINADKDIAGVYTISISGGTLNDEDGKNYEVSKYVSGSLTVNNPADTSNDNSSPSGESDSVAKYTVSFNANGGSAVNSQSISKSGKATAPNAPTRDGYTFAGWYSDEALTKEFDFGTEITANITLFAKWVEEEVSTTDPKTDWTNPFKDISPKDWYYGDVEYAYANNLFMGTSANTFSPNAPMTRAMLVTVLWRSAGSPNTSGTPYSDVDAKEYYAQAVAWSTAQGIANGIGDGLFDPDANITREQLATILARYLKWMDIDLPQKRDYAGFTDSDEISDYAVSAVELMYSLGVINGRSDGSFDPKGSATRAEVAAMLHRFLELVDR